MTTSQDPDFLDKIMEDFPEPPILTKARTHASALAIIKVAAYNRRMTLPDFIGRAALAVAIYDGDGSDTWDSATEKEPPMRDLRRRRLPRRRLRGKGFGPWRIAGMDE